VQVVAVAAGNGINWRPTAPPIADQVQDHLDDLISLANSSDGNGSYLFGGYRSGAQPFIETNAGVEYVGDQGQVQLQVGPARKVPINDAGSAVFGGIATGNGAFTTAGVAGNGGSGVISAGAVSDPGQLTGHKYRLDFDAAGTNYTVTDTTTGAAMAPAPYTSGAPITVAGMRFEIKGAPAGGDKFESSRAARTVRHPEQDSRRAALAGRHRAEKQALSDGLAQAAAASARRSTTCWRCARRSARA
jgi:flagellar hook-associated protein 3 FlgL